jgi:hypothetical protein
MELARRGSGRMRIRVADIFQEVDEEVRRERLKQLWNRYGTLVVAVAFLIIAGIGGWRGYQWWEAKQAAENGAQFGEAMSLEQKGNYAEAEAAFGRIAAQGTSGYRILARFQEAGETARRDGPAAAKLYDAIAVDTRTDAALQDLARVRAALVLLDTASFDEMRTRLEPLAMPGRPFRHTARELLAMAAWRAGDAAAARRWAEMIAADPESPPGTRDRVQMLIALSASGAKS